MKIKYKIVKIKKITFLITKNKIKQLSKNSKSKKLLYKKLFFSQKFKKKKNVKYSNFLKFN